MKFKKKIDPKQKLITFTTYKPVNKNLLIHERITSLKLKLIAKK